MTDCKNKVGSLCAAILCADREKLALLLHYDAMALDDALEAFAMLLEGYELMP